MPGLPLIQPETAGGRVARLLATAHEVLGLVPNTARVMANSAAALKGYLDFFSALRGGSLSPELTERIALLVAQENRCDYSLSAHTYLATRVAGLTDAEAARARRGRAEEPLAAAVLALAAVRGRGAVTDEQLSAIRAGGVSDGQIVEVIAHLALDAFANHLDNAAQVAVDWPLVRHAD